MESLQEFACILDAAPQEACPIFLLKNLRSFWRDNPSFWFSHAPIDSWEITHTTYTNDLDTNMHLLLHYDQIYRHPRGNPHGNPRGSTRISNTCKPIAFRFAVALALRMLHNGQYADASPWERVFILLALRHADSEGLKTLALRKCLAEAEAEASPLWCRFLNATVWDVAVWRDRAGHQPEAIVDPATLLTFQYLLESPRKHTATAPDFEGLRRCVGNVEGPRVAVSISGGVDSMVAATVALAVCRAAGKELILLHISYMNRPECEDECNLLRWWAQRLGVPLYIRRITEIQRIRQSGLRTVYEEVTRQIRFAFYRWFDCPVILGHNMDDCYENIFSNLAKQIHLGNLYGMTEVGVEQGVTILRPLLSTPKSAILAYADKEGIPHLYDSTPAWSRRGQMRDTLIPGIRAFDAGILDGLRAVVERTRFLEAQWEQAFGAWCRELQVIDGCVRLQGEFLESNRREMQFWVRVFQVLEWPRPSNKSIRNLIDMMRCEGQCNLSGQVVVRFERGAIVLRLLKK